MNVVARSGRFVWLFLVLLLGAVIYAPGLGGPFLFDDLGNILWPPALALSDWSLERIAAIFLTEDSVPQRRALARFSFALNYYFAGQRFDVWQFKLTNLAIHLTNAVLVYVLANQLRKGLTSDSKTDNSAHVLSAWLPLTVMVIWLVHPLQLTTVLYVVQRMNSLAALFSLLGLVVFCIGRHRLGSAVAGGRRWMIVGVCGGTALGVACKEVAILTPVFALLLDWYFFDRNICRKKLRWLRFFWCAVIGVLLAIGLLLVLQSSNSVFQLYDIRMFTPVERLLTETRVLVFYLKLFVLPNVSEFGLFHDDFVRSTGFAQPVTTSLCLGFWLILGGLSAWGLGKRSLWSFATVWFLAGHSVESSILPLELVHEHRNYMPLFGVIFAAVWYASKMLSHTRIRSATVALIVVGVVSSLAFATFTRANNWVDRLTLSQAMVRHHPESYRSRLSVATSYAEYQLPVLEVYGAYQRAAMANDRVILPFVEMLKIVERQLMSQLDSVATVHDTVDILNDEMIMSRRWLLSARRALVTEVSHRLRRGPVVPSGALALLSLYICARNGSTVCISLDNENLEWHQLAVSNSRIGLLDRRRLQSTLSLLMALQQRNVMEQRSDADGDVQITKEAD
jgi:hypothetical protein